MPDEDRISGIGEALEADDADEANESYESDASRTGSSSVGIPPEDTKKTTVYGRRESLNAFRAGLSKAEADLRSEHEINDVQGKEIQDAALKLIGESPEELVERVLEERGEFDV